MRKLGRSKHGSFGYSKETTEHIRIDEPIEAELRRMRKEKMPIRGGGTPYYAEEGAEIQPVFDFRSDPLDRARDIQSKAVAQRLAKKDISIEAKTNNEGESSNTGQ